MKKIISFLILSIFLYTNTFMVYANGDQILTAPQPTFVENQIQPVSSFKMNRYLLGYNNDVSKKTYIKQRFTLDRDNFG
jgi:hypothetical protein